ncbi:hypothetical protein HK405_003621 [Cladochytrium tenue]|nr:hypothetical protein HK405_003621 [Cladochytrium tenue]
MSFTLPAQLPGPPLTDREAVADALYRAVLAFDTNDAALLQSALADDVEVELTGGGQLRGVAEVRERVFDRVGALDTTHLVSNVRVALTGPTEASATCTALAQHARPGLGREPGPNRFMTGALYACELVKVGEIWKIKSWRAKFLWSEGDPEVMRSTAA